jgi:hypothetical protein
MAMLTLPVWLNRRLLLHAMLVALGCAAASGVLAVVLSSSGAVWRIAGMSLAAGVTAGMLMPLSILAEKKNTAAAGLFGMAWAVLMFVLVVAAIWADTVSWYMSGALMSAIGATTLSGLTSVVMLAFINKEEDRLGAFVGCAGAALSWLVLLIASGLLLVDDGATAGRVWVHGGALLGSSACIGLCLIGARPQFKRSWRLIGVLAAVAGLILVLYGVSTQSSKGEHWVVGAYALAGAVAHANLVRRVPLKGMQFAVRWAAIGATCVAATCLYLSVYFDSDFSDPFGFARLTTGAELVAVSATLAVLVLRKLNSRAPEKLRTRTDLERLKFECPRCEVQQTQPLGESMCPRCRLKIKVEASLPLCANCEYDLSYCREDRCPECGAAIEAPVSAAHAG